MYLLNWLIIIKLWIIYIYIINSWNKSFLSIVYMLFCHLYIFFWWVFSPGIVGIFLIGCGRTFGKRQNSNDRCDINSIGIICKFRCSPAWSITRGWTIQTNYSNGVGRNRFGKWNNQFPCTGYCGRTFGSSHSKHA